jgi:hypothetical protein
MYYLEPNSPAFLDDVIKRLWQIFHENWTHVVIPSVSKKHTTQQTAMVCVGSDVATMKIMLEMITKLKTK